MREEEIHTHNYQDIRSMYLGEKVSEKDMRNSTEMGQSRERNREACKKTEKLSKRIQPISDEHFPKSK